MSKKYVGKQCVYCTTALSTSADHVIAREFFLEHRRKDLPKVPACETCNRHKAQLEHYLTSVLPFGGRHLDAQTNLEALVPKRLQKNLKLRATLAAGLTRGAVVSLPVEPFRVEDLFSLIARGLMWHHWKILLETGHTVFAAVISRTGAMLCDQLLFTLRANARVKLDLGAGTFSYEGVQAKDCPQMTFWRFSIYGRMVFADPDWPHTTSSQIFAATGPKKQIEDLKASMGS